MEHYGFWSVIPPLVAIVLAIKTRQVFLSLLSGIWIGWIILNNGNIISGTLVSIESLVDVFKDSGNTRTIIFSCLIGGLIALVQRSGGVEGFIQNIHNFLQKLNSSNSIRNEKIIQLLAFLTGAVIFIETNISVLTAWISFQTCLR